jgi:hypothetical protein
MAESSYGSCDSAGMVADSPTSSIASPITWVALTIDCPDAEVQERLRHFYAQALGGEVVSGSVRARGWLLIFDVIPDYKPPTWPLGETPKQMHFEWMVEDLESAVGTLQGPARRCPSISALRTADFESCWTLLGTRSASRRRRASPRCSGMRRVDSTADRHASLGGLCASGRSAIGMRPQTR